MTYFISLSITTIVDILLNIFLFGAGSVMIIFAREEFEYYHFDITVLACIIASFFFIILILMDLAIFGVININFIK